MTRRPTTAARRPTANDPRRPGHPLSENTLLIFTSDNGPWAVQELHGGTAGPLRGAKGTNWEGGQRVPMIVSWPGHVAPASLMTEVVTAMDLLPSIASILGVPLDPNHILDGEALAEALTGPPVGRSGSQATRGRQAPFLFYASKGAPAAI